MAAAAVVPHDLSLEILAKLPFKSLMRFSCVCKTWYSIITSDPQFSKTWCSYNNLHPMRPCVLLCENLRSFSTITAETLLTAKDPTPTPLPLPWGAEPDGKNIFIGSCNGLICVDHVSCDPDRSGLILWNPSTRKFRRLPRPRHYLFNNVTLTYVWFGYDESIDDYKLIWLRSNELDVFALKSNTWRRRSVERTANCGVRYRFQAKYGLNSKSIGVFSNGGIHWFTRYIPVNGGFSRVGIMALDLATEKFRILKFSNARLGLSPWLGSLGGCLCLSTNARALWVMKEYGVESSWTKLLSIALPDDFLRFYPLLFFKEEGEEIVAVWDDGARFPELFGRIVKLRVEKGAIRFEKTLCGVSTPSVIILQDLHMEESLVSLLN